MQLILDIQLRHDATFDNFLVNQDNAPLLAFLKQPSSVSLMLGDEMSGLSHLLQAACHEAGKRHQHAMYLPLKICMHSGPEIFEGLESLDLLCVDDIQLLVSHAALEEALFHLFNRFSELGKPLVLASHGMPQMMLKDLNSRLQACFRFRLKPLGDQDKQLFLQQEARRRGFLLSDEVAGYLIRHYPRDMASQLKMLQRLDIASLQEKHKITLPFVKDILNKD